MSSPDFASYLPSRVLELLPRSAEVPALRELPAAVLVTDISGFTPIAERMVREGPQGVERLGALLNGFYSELFGRVDQHGGEVITIVGDGVISVWPALSERELPAAIEQASQCGLRISRELHGHRPDGDMPLSVRTGLGAGALRLVRLGDDERWELVLLGDAVVQACGAERRAVPGTFTVAQSAWPVLGQLAHGRALDERFVQVLDQRSSSEPAHVAFVPHAPRAAREGDASLRRYLAEPVRTVLDAGGSRWLAELRHVTVAFLHLCPPNDGLGDGAVDPPVLQAALSELQATAHRYAGTFDKLVLDDKGLVANFIFGLPPHAHENDAERAVLAALEARERLLRKRLPSSIGVASGRVFWGPIGSQARRQYCLVGSVMSLGARIMQAAQDEVLCCPDTRAAVRGKVLWEDAGRRRLKGFEDEVELSRPSLARGSQGREALLPRICHGRERERALLVAAVERALAGQGGALLIEGDAGVGKSTLIEALHALARDAGVRTLVVAGDPIEQGSPYRAFRSAILGALGLSELDGSAELARELTAQVDALPGMQGLAPLLGSAIEIAMADSPETEQLEGQLRADRTHDVVVALLTGLASSGLLLVLEDMHWLDSASLRLAALLRRRAPAIAFVMTTRRVHVSSDDHQALRERADTRIDLAPLEKDGIARLIAERLRGARVAPPVLTLLFERSGGNPLFAESLALALARSGALILRDDEVVLAPGAAWDEDRIPTSLDTVIGSRVDALHSPFDIATLKAAAVLGPAFDVELLLHVHPEEPSAPALEESLAILREHGLVASTDRSGMLAFDHAITQEVTYARLPLAQRRELHRRAADAYTRAEAARPDLARSYPRLAHHYERAHAWADACDALDLAALSASRSGAFREAASFLSRALAILAREPQLRQGVPLREVRWQRMLGEARDALGHKERMAEHARAALELLGMKPPATRLARSASIAASALQEALSSSSVQLGRRLDQQSAFEATRAAQVLAAHHYYALEPLAMVQNVLLAMRAAEQSDSAGDRAKCYAGVGLLLGMLGAHPLARRYVERALAACDEATDAQAFTRARVLSALYCVGTADFAGCTDIVADAQRVAAARNDHWSYCEAQAIFIWSLVYRGLFERVPDAVAALRERAERADHGHLSAWALRFEGSQHLGAGRPAQALAAFRAALPIVSGQGDNPERVLVLGSLSLALLYEGREGEAGTVSDEACAALARNARPTSHIMVHGLCDLLETLQALALRAPSAALRDKARAVLRVLAQCGSSFPVAEARFRLYEGRAALLDARPGRARASFKRGLAAASRAALRHDRAMLELALEGQALSADLRYAARERMQKRPR